MIYDIVIYVYNTMLYQSQLHNITLDTRNADNIITTTVDWCKFYKPNYTLLYITLLWVLKDLEEKLVYQLKLEV